MTKKEITISQLGRWVLFHALRGINENGKKMSFGDVAEMVHGKLQSDGQFPEWIFERMSEKNSLPKWKAHLHLQSIQVVKCDWLVKNDGFWELTEAGQDAMKVLSTVPEFDEAVKKERQKRKRRESQDGAEVRADRKSGAEEEEQLSDDSDVVAREIDITEKKSDARKEIDAFIDNMEGHPFQCLVAALLRGMGYYVSYVSPPNTPDAGIDIIAYKELAGMALKVEVKHRKDPASAAAIDRLRGKLGPQDIGVFVSTGGFVRGLEKACREDRGSRIELIDLDRFIDLWREHYHKMRESDQELMHMERVYFLTGKGANDDTKDKK